MADPLLKETFVNIPISVKKSWRDNIKEKAKRLGMSQNAAFCLIVRFGAPFVEAHLLLMEKNLKAECRKIASGKVRVKKSFP